MRIIFFLSLILVINLNAVCSVSTDCESPLSSMSSAVEDYIDSRFDELDTEIDYNTSEYVSLNEELDKEIYVLEIYLKGQINIYKKLNQIDALVKKSKEIVDLDITIENILHEISENSKGDKKNEKK